MSFRAVDWAVRQRIPTFQKMVLIMLSDRHNSDTGRCDPSHDLLAADCGMSRRSVIEQIAKLEKLGLITAVNRQKDGIKTSNQYRLHLSVFIGSGDKPDVQEMHIDVQEMHGGSAGAAQGVVQEMHINPEVEPVKEPVIKSSPASRLAGCPHQKLLSLWAKHLPHLEQPRVWEGNRRACMKQRWIQASKKSDYSPEGYRTEQDGLEWWDGFFGYIARDTKLSDGFESNGRSWRPTLEWVVNSANFQKIIDGKYNK